VEGGTLGGALDDPRAHEDVGLVLRVGAEDEQPPQEPDLRRGEPGARRVLEAAAHPRDLGAQDVVDVGDREGGLAQRRVAPLPDPGVRHG